MPSLFVVQQNISLLRCFKDKVMGKQLTGGRLEPSSTRCWLVSLLFTQRTENSCIRISNTPNPSLTTISWLLMPKTFVQNSSTRILTSVLAVEQTMLKRSRVIPGLSASTGTTLWRKQSHLLTSLSSIKRMTLSISCLNLPTCSQAHKTSAVLLLTMAVNSMVGHMREVMIVNFRWIQIAEIVINFEAPAQLPYALKTPKSDTLIWNNS